MMNLSKTACVSLLTFMGLTMLAGCSVVGAAAYVFRPPEVSKAKYVPTTRPLAVFIDSERQSGNLGPTVKDSVAAFLVTELREHKVGGAIQDVERVYDLRLKDRKAFRTMKVDEVGKAVGVEQVLYVDLTEASIEFSNGGALMKGHINGYVRIVDVASGRTLWPDSLNDGFPASVESPFVNGNEATAESLKETLSRSMADAIAKLFYTYSLE
jgi:hypothetical protein